MSPSSDPSRRGAPGIRRAASGALIIVAQAAALGLVANALHPSGLPLRRVPLSETRRVAAPEEVLPPAPPALAIVPAPVPAPALPPPPAPEPAPLPEPPAPETPSPNPPADEPKPAPPKPAAPKPPPTPKPAPPKPAPAPEALFTTLEDARALHERGDALFLDARHREDFDGEHIAGARSLFVGEVDRLYDEVLAGVPKDRTIVTYCSDPQCGTALELADALVARGHTRVFILMEGMPGWKDAGYPTGAGAAP